MRPPHTLYLPLKHNLAYIDENIQRLRGLHSRWDSAPSDRFSAKEIAIAIPSGTEPAIKALFVIAFILWQGVACYPLYGLVARVFSAEWHHQFETTGVIIFGETDKVSKLDSDAKDYFRHFFSGKSSWSFCIAGALSVLLRILAAIAPATISIFQADEETILIMKSVIAYYVTILLVVLTAAFTPLLYRGWGDVKNYPFTLENIQGATLKEDK
ncbi:hypothetical protein BDQ17DRAFT_1435802 [Cyathus striatus]|nr:hypothetical protein BDQ17DRAFT_1435802 [Cyathus striatus]